MKARAQFPPESEVGGNSIRREIGLRLAEIRGKRSQEDFAAVLGVHKNTYGGYERGSNEVGGEAIAHLVAEGWNANWILTGAGPERLDALQPAIQSQSQDVSGEDLTIAMQLADRKIAADRKAPTREQYAHFVALIYNAITQGLPDADRYDLATGRKTHTGTGDDDGGGQGMGK